MRKTIRKVLAITIIIAVFVPCTVASYAMSYKPHTSKTLSEQERNDNFNILLVGLDSVGYNTDIIMLVSVNGQKISVMQFPRDTYYHNAKLNSRFYSVMNNDKDIASAADALRRELSATLCTEIDYYAVIDMKNFSDTVDIIGGVTVDVPFDMNYEDKEQDLFIHLKKGRATLDGNDALSFIRFRSTYLEGDIGRMDAQKIFACAFADKLLQTDKATLARVAINLKKNVITSLNLFDIMYFAMLSSRLDMENISLMTASGAQAREYDGDGIWYYSINRAGCIKMISQYFASYDEYDYESNFDKEAQLTSDENENLREIYYMSDKEYEKVYTAKRLAEESIKIYVDN